MPVLRRVGPDDEPLPRVLAQTPGVVLIDELDVHLHPKWQRSVVETLRKVFPRVQFIGTTHSPLVVGEVEGNAVHFLYWEGGKVATWTPTHALGLDANRILEDVMGVPSHDPDTSAKLHEVAQAIDGEQFDQAHGMIATLEARIGDDADLVRSKALLSFQEGKQ